MNVKTIEVFGFISALKALRLPFKGYNSSDSVFHYTEEPIKNNNEIVSFAYNIGIGEKDLKLLQRLIKNGDEHAKVVRGIIASCSIIAPRYWWQEMDTYKIGTERLSSESTLHNEAKGLSGEELQKFKAEIKEGLEQERIQEFSYQTLRRIYFQRKNHKLPEWKVFNNWIESLPLSNELITI